MADSLLLNAWKFMSCIHNYSQILEQLTDERFCGNCGLFFCCTMTN